MSNKKGNYSILNSGNTQHRFHTWSVSGNQQENKGHLIFRKDILNSMYLTGVIDFTLNGRVYLINCIASVQALPLLSQEPVRMVAC